LSLIPEKKRGYHAAGHFISHPILLALRRLKGQCHEIFCFWFFYEQFSPSPRVFHLDRFKFFRKFASQGAPPVSTTPGWQIFPPFSLVLLIPAANLPAVSTIPAANLPPLSTTPVANCHQYQQPQRQIMATISGCRHLKVNLKAKIYIYVNSTTQRCPNKIIKIFLLEGFFQVFYQKQKIS
jgi:hypothetical protein